MKRLNASTSADTPTLDLVPAGSASALGHGLARLGRILAGLSMGLLIVLGVLILVRLGVAWYLQTRIAEAAGDLSRVGGFDARIAQWLDHIVSWSVAFALVNEAWRAIARALNPIAFGPWRWQPTAMLLALSGGAALLPSAVQSLRGVDATGRPARMEEVSDPAQHAWFAPDGRALLAFSREPDGRLRFWNREGLTPDRALPAEPVTGAVRHWWEQAEGARAAAERAAEETRKATQRREREKLESSQRQAANRAAAQRAAEEKKRSDAERERKEQESKAATVRQLAELRRELDQAKATRTETPRAVVPPAASLRAGDAVQLGFRLQPPIAPPRVQAARSTLGHSLRPGLTLVVQAHRQPCEVWADVEFVVFPNDPSLAHARVPAGRVFRFPRLGGTGPTTIHARPTGSGGTLWMRPLE